MFYVNQKDAEYWEEKLLSLITSHSDMRTMFYMLRYTSSIGDLLNKASINDKEISFSYGASKLVIISSESDVIIKIPLTATEDYNYCELEAEMYEKAINASIDEYFAGTVYGGRVRQRAIIQVNDVFSLYNSYSESYTRDRFKFSRNEIEKDSLIDFPFYYAEKMTVSYRRNDDSGSDSDYDGSSKSEAQERIKLSENSIKEYNDFLSKSGSYSYEYGFSNPKVGSIFFGQYGVVSFLKISNFIKENDINDLHRGNIMYDINGRIRFIDYSGYHG